MKVIQLNHTDIHGGAARAAYRLHHALREANVDSEMWVDFAYAGDWTVKGPEGKLLKGYTIVKSLMTSFAYRYFFNAGNSALHSPALLPSSRVNAVNFSQADVIHLHWVQGDMLSVADIGRLSKPAVWTLHDMWAFCGAEHYTEDFRWSEGYLKAKRPIYEGGFDLNRWTWRRKLKSWKQPMHIVTPSKWLAQCVKDSVLMRDWPVTIVPNCINTNKWYPLDKNMARTLLGLPKDVPLLLFGAVGGTTDPRKGFDLLVKTLKNLSVEIKDLELLVFGQMAPKNSLNLGCPINYMGQLNDDLSLQILYSAADVTLIPSRQDNLPNTGLESLACGTPIVAFEVCGLPDIVMHQKTGYLAEPFNTEDLAYGVNWVLNDVARHNLLSKQSRAYAIDNFSDSIIAKKYINVYQEAMNNKINI